MFLARFYQFKYNFNSNSFPGIPHKTIGFYGNDGTCVFKYLVTQDDPQWIFSTSIVTINFLCFIFVTSSYVILAIRTGRSARGAGNTQAQKRQLTLQRKVTAIIATDFLCWVPLSIVSFLHLGEVIQATSWYAYFSILIIPINSVINPLLYDSLIFEYLVQKPIDMVKVVLKKWSSRLNDIFHSLFVKTNKVEPQSAQSPESPEEMPGENSDEQEDQDDELNVISVDINDEIVESLEKIERKKRPRTAQSPETPEEMPKEDSDRQEDQEDELNVEEPEILADERASGDKIVESFELTQKCGFGYDLAQGDIGKATTETALTE